MEKKSKARLLKTPIHKIPIGEAVKKPDGRYCIRIKRPKGEEVEEVLLDQLLSMVVTEADDKPVTAETPASRVSPG